MEKRDTDELEAELAMLERSVSIEQLKKKLDAANVSRSTGSLILDAARGELRMARVCGYLFATTPEEADRYVQTRIALKNAEREARAKSRRKKVTFRARPPADRTGEFELHL